MWYTWAIVSLTCFIGTVAMSSRVRFRLERISIFVDGVVESGNYTLPSADIQAHHLLKFLILDGVCG